MFLFAHTTGSIDISCNWLHLENGELQLFYHTVAQLATRMWDNHAPTLYQRKDEAADRGYPAKRALYAMRKHGR